MYGTIKYYYVGSGVPNELQMRRYQPIPIAPQGIPSTDEAKQKYVQQRGRLTEFGLFGGDPLRNSLQKIHRRDEIFASNSPTFEAIFNNVISGDGSLLRSSILTHINIPYSGLFSCGANFRYFRDSALSPYILEW